MMKGLSKLIITEFKRFTREFEGLFFTLVFPVILLLVFGSIYGNKPSDYFNGFGFIDVSVPAYLGMIIAIGGLMSIPISVASDREKGILHRLRATPLKPRTIMLAWIIFYFLITLAGSVILVATGKIFYGLRFQGNVFNVFLGFTLCTTSFLTLGFMLASVIRSGRTANVIGMSLFFPMLFFSGAMIPSQGLSTVIKNIGKFIPLTYVVNLMQGLWFGDTWSAHKLDIIVLIAMSIVMGSIAVKIFKWE
ncbi:ABC transporter permease [candidate division TA06 bacterium]|uniref:ABC transporter permease n=1 Tax=candidate division TA06 bacterium TaxID=2250710 RepID=A0A660SKS3_UNCT6|nr:MAG: ABC transporter permease [candidate division TA06 bacterium]